MTKKIKGYGGTRLTTELLGDNGFRFVNANNGWYAERKDGGCIISINSNFEIRAYNDGSHSFFYCGGITTIGRFNKAIDLINSLIY